MEGQDGKDQGTSRPPTPEHEPEHVIEPLTPGHPSALAGGSAEERFITQLTRELERVARPRNLRPLAIHHPAPIPEEEEEGPAQEEEAPQEEEALQEEEAPQEEEALQEEEAPQEEEAAQEEEALQEEEAAQEEEAPQEEEAAQEEEEEEEEEAAQEEEEAAQEEEDFSEDDAIEEVFQHIYAMEVRSHRNPSGDSPSVTWDEFEEAVLAEAEQLEDVPLDLEVLAENMMHLGLADEELQAVFQLDAFDGDDDADDDDHDDADDDDHDDDDPNGDGYNEDVEDNPPAADEDIAPADHGSTAPAENEETIPGTPAYKEDTTSDKQAGEDEEDKDEVTYNGDTAQADDEDSTNVAKDENNAPVDSADA